MKCCKQVSQELIWVLAGVAAFVGTAAVGVGVSHLVHPLFIVRYSYPASMAAYMVMGILHFQIELPKILGNAFMHHGFCLAYAGLDWNLPLRERVK